MSDDIPQTPQTPQHGGATPEPEPRTDRPDDVTPEPAQPAGAAPDPAGLDRPDLVDANVDLDAAQGTSRRRLLTLGAVGVGVVAAAGVGSWAFIRSDRKDSDSAGGLTVTKSWADRKLTVTAPSGVCDAPLVVAYEKGFFRDAGLNVVLKKTGTDEDATAAVGSGKYIATNGIFFNFLGPIYNGTPVKLSGGLHHGCLDLYVRNDGSVPTVASLRGRKIGVSSLQGSATNFFSLDLLDAGINSSPAAKQVTWVVIEQDLLPKALQDKKVDAIATAGGFLPIIQGVKAGWAKELSDNRSLSRNASYPCCAVALNETFVDQDPVTAANFVNAWARGSRYAGANLQETAEIESARHHVPDTPANILPVLQTLTFDPSPRNLRQQLEPGIAKFIHTGFLPADTDAKALADKVFVNLGLNFVRGTMDLRTLTAVSAPPEPDKAEAPAATTVQGAARIHAALEMVTHPVRVNPILISAGILAWIAFSVITKVVDDSPELPLRDATAIHHTTDFTTIVGAVVAGLAALLWALSGLRGPLGARAASRVAHGAAWLFGSALWAIFWETSTAKTQTLSTPYFAAPQEILEHLWSDKRILAESLGNSLKLLALGFVLGLLAGLVTGVVIGWWQQANYWVHPVLMFLGPVPTLAWVPVIFVLFPSSYSGAVFLIAVSVWFPITVLTRAGIVSIPRSYYDVTQTLGAKSWFLMLRVSLPAALPSIFTGAFMALGSSFVSLTVAENFGVNSGLGWYLNWQKSWGDFPGLYAGIVVLVAVCGVLLTLLFRLRGWVLRWEKELTRW